jgi:uncharacterized protein RhaS with RHS repeats
VLPKEKQLFRGRRHWVISGYRFYQPELGRWVSRDPIAENGGLNLYGFVGNSPLTYWDILGLDHMKAFNNWLSTTPHQRVGIQKAKMWSSELREGKELERKGIELHHFFQLELHRLESKGYNVECFSVELMDAIYLEIQKYWRTQAGMLGMGMVGSQTLRAIEQLVKEYSVASKNVVKVYRVEGAGNQRLITRPGGKKEKRGQSKINFSLFATPKAFLSFSLLLSCQSTPQFLIWTYHFPRLNPYLFWHEFPTTALYQHAD